MFTASDVIYSDRMPIIDPISAGETVRLTSQHQAMHYCLDVLPPLPPATAGQRQRVLDLACATGDWLLEVAFWYPSFEVIGIDRYTDNVLYANARVRAQNRQNISCEVMDLAHKLKFPRASFDLIYGRFLAARLPARARLPLLQQCARLLRPGGVLRLLEVTNGHCTSPACEQLSEWYQQALVQANVRPERENMLSNWLGVLKQAGYQQINPQEKLLDFSEGQKAYHDMRKVMQGFFLQAQSFVVANGIVTAPLFEQTYRRMYGEIGREDFAGHWSILDLQATIGPA